eukprot:Opistho-2@42669
MPVEWRATTSLGGDSNVFGEKCIVDLFHLDVVVVRAAQLIQQHGLHLRERHNHAFEKGNENVLDEADLRGWLGHLVAVHKRRNGKPCLLLEIALRKVFLQQAVQPRLRHFHGPRFVGNVATLQKHLHQQLFVLHTCVVDGLVNALEILHKVTMLYHVGCKNKCNHPLADQLERVIINIGKYVAFRLAKDFKSDGAVVVLEGADIVVADGQLCACVDLICIVLARMIEIVADGRHDKDELVQLRKLVLKLAQVYHAVHHLRDAKTVAEVVEGVVLVVLLDTHKPVLERQWVDLKLRHKSEIVENKLEQVEHLVGLPLPNIESWVPQILLCLIREYILGEGRHFHRQ